MRIIEDPAALRLTATLLVAVALPRLPAWAEDVLMSQQTTDTSAHVRALFANPPAEYSSAPLWVWNDRLTEQQVVQTLEDLAAQQVKQAFVHPRPGLMTPYLSDEWFRLWKVALRTAERLDMNLWIYDENSYPSGFAGGLVPDAMPEARGRGLALREEQTPPAWSEDLIAVFRVGSETYENVSAAVRAGGALPEDRYFVFALKRAENSPWFGGKCYVDLLYPGVTEKFIEITLEGYRREVGHEFGRRIPGVFTDEPHICPAGGLPWTDDLPAQFEKRWGYNLVDHLPALSERVGDWKRVRHNYHQLLLELFIERWARPMHDYCQKHHLEFTGHYWEHDWPRPRLGPDNMAMYAWQQRPGIDILFNQYGEDVHAQFGNIRAVKELSSVANQLGRKRTLCEAYGAAGWDIRFEDLKRIGEWLYVLGVNTLDQHLSYVSIRGARKRDHPESFSYHEPWWDAYHTRATYFARLSAALSSGEEVNRVLVLEPTTTAWMYNTAAGDDGHLKEIGDAFQALVAELAKEQVEFDLGCEDVVARHGDVSKDALRIGRRSYEVLILPPHTENLNSNTMDLVERFVRARGRVLCCGAAPPLVDAVPSGRAPALASSPTWHQVEAGALPRSPDLRPQDGFSIQRNPRERALLLHHRRHLADGEILFLVNTSIDALATGAVNCTTASVEKWDLGSGEAEPYPHEAVPLEVGQRAAVPFTLEPCGSLLLFLSKQRGPAGRSPSQSVNTIRPSAPPEIRRVGPNVLTLDYVDVSAGGEARTGLYFYQANQFVFQKHGLERNPWDSAVQFRDELLRKTFTGESGFEATYGFTIEGRVPPDLAIVLERPDLYATTCNGKAVAARSGEWWLDRAFGRIDLAAAAQVGENRVVIRAQPFTMLHELEPAYILGDFALRATDRGFVITPPQPLRLGRWNDQGCPFYADGVTYSEPFELPVLAGTYRVALPAWYGSVAKVTVNGTAAGYIYAPPYELDVTALLRSGTNAIEVTVIGTLKNTLGPHHGNPPLGVAWPHMFQQAPAIGPPPGEQYHTVGYGLFEPFVLRQSAE